jgi:hypothetical protein
MRSHVNAGKLSDQQVSRDFHQARCDPEEKTDDQTDGGNQNRQFHPAQQDGDRLPNDIEMKFKAVAHGSCFLFWG